MSKKKILKDEENGSGGLGDFGSAISALCDEKGISKEKVIETIEAALSAAYKKDYGKKGQNIRAMFDERTGGTKFFLLKEVADETTREFVKEEEIVGTDLASVRKTDLKSVQADKKSVSEKVLETEEEKLPRFNPERDMTLADAKKLRRMR